MTRYTKAFQGVFAAIALSLASAKPIFGQEIEWREIPGTQLSDEVFGDTSSFIGTNTITRNGDAINFDLLNSADDNYARISGNCRTGWKVMAAGGFYGSDGPEIYYEGPVELNQGLLADHATRGLELACSLSS